MDIWKNRGEENYLAQHPPLLINNAHFCYDGLPLNDVNDKKNTFYYIKKNTQMSYTDGSKSMGKKVGRLCCGIHRYYL